MSSNRKKVTVLAYFLLYRMMQGKKVHMLGRDRAGHRKKKSSYVPACNSEL